MALRDQPYLPLYIQDIMTDEKLNECSAATHGIYIKGIMCLMHKSEYYGKIELKQKYQQIVKQNTNQIEQQFFSMAYLFAAMLDKHLPYSTHEIEAAITQLIDEKVCFFDGFFLCQKRMIKDGEISQLRVLVGRKGGNASKNKAKDQAKVKQNTENEYENDIDNTLTKESIIYPYVSDEFKKAWNEWKKYKKEQKAFKFKSILSEQKSLNLLAKEASSEKNAIEMLDRAMAKGWQSWVTGEIGVPIHKKTEEIKSLDQRNYYNYQQYLDDCEKYNIPPLPDIWKQGQR